MKLAALVLVIAVVWICIAPSVDLPDSTDVRSSSAKIILAHATAVVAMITRDLPAVPAAAPSEILAAPHAYLALAAGLNDVYCVQLC